MEPERSCSANKPRNVSLCIELQPCVLAVCALALKAGEEPIPVVTGTLPPHLGRSDRLSHHSHKLAIVASDTALPDTLELELRNAKPARQSGNQKDNATALTRFNGGKKDGDSGDFVAQLDFSNFTTPGRYDFVLTAPGSVRSYKFNVADNPYYESDRRLEGVFITIAPTAKNPKNMEVSGTTAKPFLDSDKRRSQSIQMESGQPAGRIRSARKSSIRKPTMSTAAVGRWRFQHIPPITVLVHNSCCWFMK